MREQGRNLMDPIPGRAVATLEIMRDVVDRSPFTHWLAATVTLCERGLAKLEVPIDTRVTQHHGFVHGGVVGAIADNACAWAAASVAGDVVTVEYKVNLLAPALRSLD